MLWAAYITNTLAQSQTSSADLAIRTELLEQTRVAHSELFEFERTIDTKFDEAISELKDCLNKIQQDRLCD